MQTPFATIRNILLVVIAAALLLCVGAHKAYMLATGTAQSETRSALEGRMYQAFPQLTAASVASGDFQAEFEQYTADALPMREDVLLANASAQRWLVTLANKPFAFDSYPTFYGSDVVYTPRTGNLAERPVKQSITEIERIAKPAALLGKAAARRTEQHWVFALVDRSSTTAALPAHALVANPLDYQATKQVLIKNLPSSLNFVDLSYASEQDYLHDYFLTDHHWQATGSYKAYTKICHALGQDAVIATGASEIFHGPFWGSAARSGLYAPGTGDTVYDYPLQLGNLRVSINGKKADTAALGYSARTDNTGYTPQQRFSNCYADLFHTDYATMEISNPHAASASTLLIVGDSFTNNSERLFAQNYARVIAIDPRHCDKTLNDLIESEQVDDVLFLISQPNFASEEMVKFLQ